MEIRVTVAVEITDALGKNMTTVSTSGERHAGDNPRFTRSVIEEAAAKVLSRAAAQAAVGVGYDASTMTEHAERA